MKTRKRLIILLVIVALLSGASLSVAQESDYSLRELADRNNFYMGAAVYRSHLADPAHQEVLRREFNMLTPENEAKACEVQPRLGEFDFRKFDALMAFAETNDMVVRGHTLLWHQCVPQWLNPGQYTREEAIQHLRDHIMTVVGRYKGRIAMWDVVNEAVADSGGGLRDTPWHSLIGDDYIELAFRFAHEADPDALLFYNDYGAEGMNGKSNAIYNLVKDLLADGVPIHGVGLQMHINVGDTAPGKWLRPDQLSANIQRLGELGLEVHITEMDVKYPGETTESILQEQAADYRRVLETCLDSGYCTAFVTWGITDKFTWLRGVDFFDNPTVEPLLFDESYAAKPAYFAILDALARRAGETPVLSDAEVSQLMESAQAEVDTPVVVEIPEPTKSDPAQLAPDSVPGAVYYAPFPVTITLDGDTSDWANVPRVTVDSGPVLPANHDTAITFAVAADDSRLYLLAEVQDSTVTYGTHDPGSEWYKEDSVEFYINATGDLKTTSYQPGIAQIGMLAANVTQPDNPIIGGGNSASAQPIIFAVETETGYLIEASVPLVNDVWSIVPEHLGVLGFQAHLNGASGPTDRDTKLIWSVYDTQDQSYNNPSLFGQLIFWDSTQ